MLSDIKDTKVNLSLFLKELLKETPEAHPHRAPLQAALDQMTELSVGVNVKCHHPDCHYQFDPLLRYR